jgi:ribosomal protein L16 Arg81 hydroxylase
LPNVYAEIESLIASGAAVFIGKLGSQYSGAPPTDAVSADAILQSGYTLGFRHVNKNDLKYAHLADRFQRALNAPIDIHLYCTPADQPGFGWHYDAEDVFVLQVSGSKHWYLRKNTVHPWPVLDAIPANQRYEREQTPLEHCFLKEGDWLYIPGGYWHKTIAGAVSTSLSVGARAHTAIDYIDFLRPRLVQSIFWRQRFPPSLPHSDTGAQLMESSYCELIQTFVEQLTEEMLSTFNIRDFIEMVKTANCENLPANSANPQNSD